MSRCVVRCSRPLALFVLAALAGCGRETPPAAEKVAAPPVAPPSAPLAPAADSDAVRGPTVVFLGDSLTAGFRLAAEEAFPALVERLLAERELPVRAINAGISGDTSAGGLARLDWLLAQRPAIVFVCLGANDGLRGLPPEATEANLRAIVERSKAAGAKVLLAGIQIPPNYGPEYTTSFREVFPRLARELEIPLLPFLLEGVAADPALNLRDGIHPNAKGHRVIAEAVASALEPLVESVSSRTG